MTTRFSLSELSEMLGIPVDTVRRAVQALSKEGELTAESFEYGERNWRIAPSDVKRVTQRVEVAVQTGQYRAERPRRRVKSKRRISETGQK